MNYCSLKILVALGFLQDIFLIGLIVSVTLFEIGLNDWTVEFFSKVKTEVTKVLLSSLADKTQVFKFVSRFYKHESLPRERVGIHCCSDSHLPSF